MSYAQTPILSSKILWRFERRKQEIQNCHPTCKIGSNPQWANKLLIKGFLEEGQIHGFVLLWGFLWITPISSYQWGFSCLRKSLGFASTLLNKEPKIFNTYFYEDKENPQHREVVLKVSVNFVATHWSYMRLIVITIWTFAGFGLGSFIKET